jgi:hypothetical protein
MRPNLLLATLLAATAAVAAAATVAQVSERDGNIDYTAAGGAPRALTSGGGFSEPVLAPDGRTVAFIHVDGPPPEGGDGNLTSLWIGDGATGQSRKLIGPHPATDVKENFESFDGPKFSLDGGFVYVSASAWATSPAVHQVSVATGQEHFVIDGAVMSLIRTGQYRGYLLVQRHMYYNSPQGGSYNPVYVVRPDAKQSFIVPGSDKDDGAKSVDVWLKAHGWQAW